MYTQFICSPNFPFPVDSPSIIQPSTVVSSSICINNVMNTHPVRSEYVVFTSFLLYFQTFCCIFNCLLYLPFFYIIYYWIVFSHMPTIIDNKWFDLKKIVDVILEHGKFHIMFHGGRTGKTNTAFCNHILWLMCWYYRLVAGIIVRIKK